MGFQDNPTIEEQIKECDRYIEMYEMCKQAHVIKKERLINERIKHSRNNNTKHSGSDINSDSVHYGFKSNKD